MNKINLNNNFTRVYQNRGQHAEQVVIFTLSGNIEKASNLSFDKGGDYLDFQIKSARATICKGNTIDDLDKHLALDFANKYIYVMQDFETAYIMNKDEYREFVKEFMIIDYNSKTKEAKIRLPKETKKVVEYLAKKC